VGLFYTKNGDGTFQSNIIENIPREKSDDYNIHCTIKPLKLMEKLVRTLVPPMENNIVLDPFAGSGTTLLAALNLNIAYVGIEIESSYIDIIRKRLEEKSANELF
jgi:site-specific DNA-methyltransferase (adenine-specific)